MISKHDGPKYLTDTKIQVWHRLSAKGRQHRNIKPHLAKIINMIAVKPMFPIFIAEKCLVFLRHTSQRSIHLIIEKNQGGFVCGKSLAVMHNVRKPIFLASRQRHRRIDKQMTLPVSKVYYNYMPYLPPLLVCFV